MKIFNKTAREEMLKVTEGQEYIFEYVDCGHVFQDVCINVNGEMFVKTESCYNDVKTGTALDCYYRYDDENNYVLAIRNLDGTIELA